MNTPACPECGHTMSSVGCTNPKCWNHDDDKEDT